MTLQRRAAMRRTPLRMKPRTCCGKKAYATREAAEVAIWKISLVSSRDKTPRRAYEGACGWWHLTSMAKATGPAQTSRELVLERDEYRCGRCGVAVLGGPWSIQHRRARGAGGTSDPARDLPSNLVLLCGSATSPGGCHLWCEQRNRQAEIDGFVIPLNSVANPLETPIKHAIHGLVLLTADGGWRPA